MSFRAKADKHRRPPSFGAPVCFPPLRWVFINSWVLLLALHWDTHSRNQALNNGPVLQHAPFAAGGQLTALLRLLEGGHHVEVLLLVRHLIGSPTTLVVFRVQNVDPEIKSGQIRKSDL